VPRAGLHHGTAIERGDDFFGATVDLAARVAAQTHGTQVLSTQTVAGAARGRGIRVVDLGALTLRNLAAPVELFELGIAPAWAGSAIDPVCRMRVLRADAAGRLRYGEADFWFCSLQCAHRFAADPSSYVAHGAATGA
jgi:adenylate cyclase